MARAGRQSWRLLYLDYVDEVTLGRFIGVVRRAERTRERERETATLADWDEDGGQEQRL